MEKKYIVKDLSILGYYRGYNRGWFSDATEAERFYSLEDAERFISQEYGLFIIETVYIVS